MKEKLQERQSKESPPTLTAYNGYLRGLGVAEVTDWRMRKRGWLDEPVNIAGRLYLTRESIERFEARAVAGEFSTPDAGAQGEEGRLNINPRCHTCGSIVHNCEAYGWGNSRFYCERCFDLALLVPRHADARVRLWLRRIFKPIREFLT